MADLDAVRQALGAERINLVAASYGTRAALEYLRLYPQQVRRVVLDGVAPADMALPEASAPDAQAAFDALLQACAHGSRLPGAASPAAPDLAGAAGHAAAPGERGASADRPRRRRCC